MFETMIGSDKNLALEKVIVNQARILESLGLALSAMSENYTDTYFCSGLATVIHLK